MIKLALLITMLLFTASATAGDTYLEIGAGKNGSLLKNSHEWEDQDGSTGLMQPCWSCQDKGYRLIKKKGLSWWQKLTTQTGVKNECD